MNYYKGFNFNESDKLIRSALKEDSGKGDLTSKLLIPENSVSKAELLVKEDGIIAGLEIFRSVFKIIDESTIVKLNGKDGQRVKKGEVIGTVTGNTRKLLLGERVALNLLQRMSGIATFTDIITRKLGNKNIKIIDTRKTTPNLRLFEKLAVTMGGGANHRFGLYDMILIKDNHIEANGGISKTLEILNKMKDRIKVKVEIEVKNIKELSIVISKGENIIDRIMLDNFSLKDLKKAIVLNAGKFELEVSGGIDLFNINKYSSLKGIDFISIGALTHSVKSLDISFNFIT
ncbi:MAG TPA: carboxylating nicotinate-nucleotide diphosphorylase [Ignavibacteria bacterium]|nr:carboxylating nicotinate-nucleotide diphosphorylase [Ignavibacteria bacterium]